MPIDLQTIDTGAARLRVALEARGPDRSGPRLSRGLVLWRDQIPVLDGCRLPGRGAGCAWLWRQRQAARDRRLRDQGCALDRCGRDCRALASRQAVVSAMTGAPRSPMRPRCFTPPVSARWAGLSDADIRPRAGAEHRAVSQDLPGPLLLSALFSGDPACRGRTGGRHPYQPAQVLLLGQRRSAKSKRQDRKSGRTGNCSIAWSIPRSFHLAARCGNLDYAYASQFRAADASRGPSIAIVTPSAFRGSGRRKPASSEPPIAGALNRIPHDPRRRTVGPTDRAPNAPTFRLVRIEGAGHWLQQERTRGGQRGTARIPGHAAEKLSAPLPASARVAPNTSPKACRSATSTSSIVTGRPRSTSEVTP